MIPTNSLELTSPAIQNWQTVRERYYPEQDAEEYQTAVYIERLKAEIAEKDERIAALKSQLDALRGIKHDPRPF